MTYYDLSESFYMAIDALRANKLRAVLTLLGVVIGVFSIIGVMTGIGVLQSSIESSFNVLGANSFVVQKYPAVRMGGPESWWKYRNRKNITVEMARRVEQEATYAKYVSISAGRGGGVVKYRSAKTDPNVSIIGATENVLFTRNYDIGEGRMFSRQDVEYSRNVAVIGPQVAKRIMPNVDPIGKTILINNKPFTVIGVTAEKGGLFGGSQDNLVVIPLPQYQRYFGGRRSVTIEVAAMDKESFDRAIDQVIGILRKVRKVPPGEDNDFEIVTNESIIGAVNDMTYYLRVGTAGVAGIALLAAGIGIMNIMLVSVTERIREIGIRKSIGARRNDILVQFLAEAVVICQIGGIIGIILGILGGNVVAIMLSIPVVVPVDWAILGLVVCTVIGVVFGVYPAWKAANLDPVEALRYE